MGHSAGGAWGTFLLHHEASGLEKWHPLYALQVGLYSVRVGLKYWRFSINQSRSFCLAHKYSKFLVMQFQRLHYTDTATWLVRDRLPTLHSRHMYAHCPYWAYLSNRLLNCPHKLALCWRRHPISINMPHTYEIALVALTMFWQRDQHSTATLHNNDTSLLQCFIRGTPGKNCISH